MFKHCIFAFNNLTIILVLLSMIPSGNKTYGWLKKVIAAFALLLIAVIIIWYLFTLKFDDTADDKADYTVNATDFIHEFEKNDSLANIKYGEKMIIVNGTVSEVEAADSTVNIKMAIQPVGHISFLGSEKKHGGIKKNKREI